MSKNSSKSCRFMICIGLLTGAVAFGFEEEMVVHSNTSVSGEIDRGVMHDNHYFIRGANSNSRLTVGGRIQPRFEYYRRGESDDSSQFRFRRIRIDIRGYAIDDKISFRIMPEFRDNAELDTAWVNYRFSDQIQIRAGQYNLPFSWERDVSSNRHQMTERSVANNSFQWPGGGGKDIGVAVHGKSSDRIRYDAGVFGGEGKNRGGGSSEGILLSGRATWSPFGAYPNTETLLEPVDIPKLSFGAGAWFANRNSVHDWTPNAEGDQSADAYAATADAHFQIGRISSHIAGFFRRVEPEGGFSPYHGTGFTAQSGYLFVPERLFASIRYSEAEPCSLSDHGRKREILGGIQIFHHGHRSKIHIELGLEQERARTQWNDAHIARIQYQLLF